jgi:predicted enzyme related to lactoylglutathione lyase
MDQTIIHFMIPAADTEKLRQFYSEVFGWKITKHPGPMEYWEIQTVPVDDEGMLLRQGVNGGMVKKETPEQKPVNYISVESIDKSIEKVKKLGGKIVTPKQEIPTIGWIATAVDPEGNPIALLQSQRT